MKDQKHLSLLGLLFLVFASQLFSQSSLTKMNPTIKDSIKYYLEDKKGSLKRFFNFCENAITGDSYAPYDKLVVVAYEFDTRKKLTQRFEFSRLYPRSDYEKDIISSNQDTSENQSEYDQKFIANRKYYGNPHFLIEHLPKMKQLLDTYENIFLNNRIQNPPLSDAQFQFNVAYTDCELILRQNDLSLLEEEKTRTTLVNAATNYFDIFKNRADQTAQIAIHEALLEATYLLIDLALKPISELSYKEKRSLYLTHIERLTKREITTPTKELFDRFKLLNECIAFDENNSLVGFCLFFAKSAKLAGDLAGSAYYMTEAIKFKRQIKDNSINYQEILSKLYAEKADIFELADYHQLYNLMYAAELRRISFELFDRPVTRVAYAQTLSSYSEILKKNYKLIAAREKIKLAVSVAPDFAKAHYIASKVYKDLFYVYEAINSSIEAVELGVKQGLADTDEYKRLHQEWLDFFHRKNLPWPTMDGVSSKEIFRARIEFAKEYTNNLLNSINKLERIEKSKYKDYLQQADQGETNIKGIAQEMEKEDFPEKEKYEKDIISLNSQIKRLKDIIAGMHPKSERN